MVMIPILYSLFGMLEDRVDKNNRLKAAAAAATARECLLYFREREGDGKGDKFAERGTFQQKTSSTKETHTHTHDLFLRRKIPAIL